MKEIGKPLSMDERDVYGGDRAHNRRSDVQAPGLAKVLADMLRSALSWEDAHGIQVDQDKNDEEVTGSRSSDVSCSPRCDLPPDKDARVGQGDDGDGLQGPEIDV